MRRLASALAAAGLFGHAALPAPSSAQGPAQPTLKPFVPHPGLTGVIRTSGSDLAGLLGAWETGFRRQEPGVRFQNATLSGDAAIGALEAGAADIAVNGREPVLTEYLSFAEVFGDDGPFQVAVATGAFEKLGRTWAPVIYVNAKNPLARLTMDQLEGVFAGARTGGYEGYKWTTRLALPASREIRTWGQLGLAGAWRDKPIHTYGYAPTGMSNFFEQVVFHGGTTWAAGYRQYIETTAKQATDHAGTIDQMMDDLEADPYGIAWAGVAHAVGKPGLKGLALGRTDQGPFFACTPKTVADRTYPLTRSVYMQVNRSPAAPLAPAVEAFLRYVLSRDGQAEVAARDDYLPLTSSLATQELRRLESPVSGP